MTRLKTELLALLFVPALFELLSTPTVIGLAQRTRHRSQAEAWRRQPPKAEVPRPFKLPAARETRLENGLTVVLIEDHRSPLVTILVGIPTHIYSSGNISDLTNQIALAEATAELITEGAGSRSSEQVAREVETLGGRLSSSANDDYAEVAVTVVAENAERMMDLLSEVLLRPTYPEAEVALYKRNRIQNLVVQRQDPAFLVAEQFNRVVFGSHPYAISAPTPASIDELDRTRIERFYKSAFAPDKSIVVMVGDFDSARMEKKARAALADWKAPDKGSAPARPPVDFPRPARRQVYLIDRPGSEQADFRVGALAVKRADPDYFPLLVTNAILGAGTSSRLFLNIRERRGYAYDVYSSVGALREAGTFFGGAQTRTAVTVAAIREMLAEFDRLRNIKVAPRELQSAKNYLNGLFSLALSTQGGIAERVLQTHMLELGDNYLETYRARIEAVTAEQVQEAARKYLLSDRPAVVVVGDASKLRKQLQVIGNVEVFNIEGRPLKQSTP